VYAYGKKGGDIISIAVIDHKKNPGYPTYWHARNMDYSQRTLWDKKFFLRRKGNAEFQLTPKGRNCNIPLQGRVVSLLRRR
jgi:hypothetical protein